VIGDVMDLRGMSGTPQPNGHTLTDKFVLEMSYNQAEYAEILALNPAAVPVLGFLATDGYWRPAVTGNFGAENEIFWEGNAPWSASNSNHLKLGHYGYDAATKTAWAVVNHNSQFAVIPEPSTIGLLLFGLALLGLAWRRRM
jgi:hypothetical protein